MGSGVPVSPEDFTTCESHRGAASAPFDGYRRREPEKTLLQEVVRERLEPFLAREGAERARSRPAGLRRARAARLPPASAPAAEPEPEPTACPAGPGSASRGGKPKRGSGPGPPGATASPGLISPEEGLRRRRPRLPRLRWLAEAHRLNRRGDGGPADPRPPRPRLAQASRRKGPGATRAVRPRARLRRSRPGPRRLNSAALALPPRR